MGTLSYQRTWRLDLKLSCHLLEVLRKLAFFFLEAPRGGEGEEQVDTGDHVFEYIKCRCLLGVQEKILGRHLDMSQFR